MSSDFLECIMDSISPEAAIIISEQSDSDINDLQTVCLILQKAIDYTKENKFVERTERICTQTDLISIYNIQQALDYLEDYYLDAAVQFYKLFQIPSFRMVPTTLSNYIYEYDGVDVSKIDINGMHFEEIENPACINIQNGDLFVYSNNQDVNSFIITPDNSIQIVPNMIFYRTFPTMIYIQNKIYIFGGILEIDGENQPIHSCEYYDLYLQHWVEIAKFPKECALGNIVNYQDLIYITSPKTSQAVNRQIIYAYSISNNSYRKTSMHIQFLKNSMNILFVIKNHQLFALSSYQKLTIFDLNTETLQSQLQVSTIIQNGSVMQPIQVNDYVFLITESYSEFDENNLVRLNCNTWKTTLIKKLVQHLNNFQNPSQPIIIKCHDENLHICSLMRIL